MDAIFPVGVHGVVTGGGRGIGRAVVRGLAAGGVRVTVVGRDEARLRQVVEEGDAVGFQVADVSQEGGLATALSSLEEQFGPVGILVNNAGGAESGPFTRQDRGLWDRMIALNLTAVFEGCRAVLPGMVARREGRVVNVASTAGLKGYPYVAAYCAAKHGVVGLTRALALEVASSGVTVNAVCPGFTDTDLVARAAEQVSAKTGRGVGEVVAGYAAHNPQGRLVRPEEVAAAVSYLCSAGASAMTGQALAVAGGEA